MNRLLARPQFFSIARAATCRSLRHTARSFITTRPNANSQPTTASPEAVLKVQSGGKLGVSPMNHSFADPTAFFNAWHLEETKQILSSKGQTYKDYLTTALTSPLGVETMSGLSVYLKSDFADIWEAFSSPPEGYVAEDFLDDILAFFLEYCGIRILPPTAEHFQPKDCLMVMTPEEKDMAKKMATMPEKLPNNLPEFPDLMTPSPLLDPHDTLELPPTKESPFHNRVVVRNHQSIFHEYAPTWEEELASDSEFANTKTSAGDEMLKNLNVPIKYYQKLYQSILMRRGVVQQTGKGKIRRVSFMVLVGDGKGLVGYGEGKHANAMVALNAARVAAVRNMDYVERFEGRTIWTEMRTKLGSTELIMRPRPVGFGLRCNPYLHQILRAAGFKDISAKVWGSRNRLNVIKAAFRILQGGHEPTGMGDGVGGPGRKLNKGTGMRGKGEIERARGRKLVALRN